MVDGAPDSDTPEVVREPHKAEIERVTRWRRTITITGPSEWVERTRGTSLAQGIHKVGQHHGTPCLIEVEAEEAESLRFLHGTVSNGDMAKMRRDDPDGYELIHGPNTAVEHADYEERQHSTTNSSTSPSTKPDGSHVGQYL